VVYFAGRAYVLSPLTTDLNAVRMFVEGVRPAAVGLGGSSLSSGLTQALDLLAGGEDDVRQAIVLFSDGEETVEQPLGDALTRARDAGVVIHAVGLGTAEGAPIPLTRDASLDPATALRRRRGTAYLEGPDGQVVITRLEAGTLRELAGSTGGRYVEGADGLSALERQLAEGSDAPIPASGDGALGFLLVLAFASLWGEGFLFPRG
jgi:Ca-activated chloride channel family protein